MINQIKMNVVTNIVVTNKELVSFQSPKLMEDAQTKILHWSKSNKKKTRLFCLAPK